MKKITVSTSLLFLLLNSMLVKADSSNGLYADEIAMIARNEEVYTITMQNKITETTEINAVWLQIEEDTAELESFAEIKMDPLSDGIDDSTKQLYELTYESAYVENILSRLLITIPKIEAKTKKLEELLVNYDVAIKNQILEAAEFIQSELVNLQIDMNKRKQNVDSSLKVWSEWQKEIAIEAAAKDQLEVMNHLMVVNELGEIRNAFSIMKTNFLLALKKRDYEDAEGLIDGFRWLRTNSKLYFSDKISTQENYLSLQVILDDAEIQQEKMSEMLSRFASHSVDGIGDRAKYLLMPKSPINNVMMPGDGSGAASGTVEEGSTSPTTGGGRREGSEGGGGHTSSNNGQRAGDNDLVFNWDRSEVGKRKSSEKTVIQYYSVEVGWNDVGIGVARVRDSKIAKTAPVTGGIQIQEKKQKEIDDLYKKEVLPQINEETREQSAQRKPQRSEGEQSKTPPSLAKETNEASDFVNNARAESTNSNDKEGLEKLAEKIKEYANTQKKLEKTLGDKVKEVAQTQVKSIQHAKNLSGRVKAPKVVTLNSPQGASAKDKLSKITQAIASFIMGIFSGTSSSSGSSAANNIANFLKRSATERPSSGSVYATAALERASGKPREIRAINDQIRSKAMGVAREFVAKKGENNIRYSQNTALRNGPKAFDCSGFVTFVYNSAGLDMRNPDGTAKRVEGIVKSGLVYEVDKHDAKVGDLVVQFGDENGKQDDHIGIYSGKNKQGQASYISATGVGGAAKKDPPERNAIVDQRPEYVQQNWHVYRWKK